MANGPIREIAIVGLGTMGCGIAESALLNGFSLRVVDASEHETSAGMDRVRARIARHVTAGLVPPDLLAAMVEVRPGTSVADACRDAELVIEAVPEDWAIKEATAIIATNTSSFPIERLAPHVEEPGAFLGVHFFNPAEWVPGVEVVPGPATRPEVIERVFEVLRSLGKVPVVVKSSPGFLANRLQLALFVECLRCLEEGLATADEIDAVVSSTFGFRLPVFGPFMVADMAGLDVYASILDSLEKRFGERFAGASALRSLVATGAYGMKTGRGFRQYNEDTSQKTVERRDNAYKRLRHALGYDD